MLKPLRDDSVLATLVPGAALTHDNCVDWNTTAFFEAAGAGDVQAGLDAGADVGSQNQANMTPLHRAAGYGIPEVVTALLDAVRGTGGTSRRGLETAKRLSTLRRRTGG